MDAAATTATTDESLGLTIVPLAFRTERFEALAPIGDSASLNVPGTDCEVCCPGSCTGCTHCNKCNLLF